MFRYTCCLLSACLSLAGAFAVPSLAAEDAALPKGKTCQGTLVLGGKTYKLEHAVAYPAKVFDDDTIALIFSDKAIPVDKLKAALKEGNGTDDRFNLWQPHAKVNFRASGEPLYMNSWADNSSLSVSGSLKGELITKDGRASGTVTVEPEEGGKQRRLEVRFDVPLLAAPAVTKPATKETPKEEAKPKAAAINVHDLPMPGDASDVQYKQLVEQVTYKSASDVKTVASFLSKKLAEQGWKDPDGGDLITPKSAILKRESGAANLTIFVKPADRGAGVTMMTEGLIWDEPEKK